MENLNRKHKLQVKDLLLVGLLTICNILITGVSSILAFSPYTYVWLAFPLVGFLSATVYMLLLTKVPKQGAAIIYALVFSLMFFLSGWVWLGGLMAAAGIINEILRKIKGFQHKGIIQICHIVQHTAFAIGSYIPYLFYAQKYVESYAEAYGREYMEISVSLVTPGTIFLLVPLNILLAFLGTLLGRKLLKKHFEKAGMI